MHLTYEPFNARRRNHRTIFDRDTGKKVGHIQSGGVDSDGPGGIEVSLFGGKYAIKVNTSEECWGFVRGVEAVLRHVMTIAHQRAKSAGPASVDIDVLTSADARAFPA